MSTKRVHWWLRLVLAALLMSTWLTVGMASGIARADSPSPSGGESSSAGAPGPKDPTSTGVPKASPPEPHKPKANRHDTPDAEPTTDDSSGQGDPPRRHPHPRNVTAESSTPEPASKPETVSPAPVADPDGPVTVEKTLPGDEPPVVSDKPQAPPSEPQARHSDRRPNLAVVPAKPTEPKPVDPQPSATGTPTYRSAIAPPQQSPIQAVNAQPLAANIAPADTTPKFNTTVSQFDLPQLSRQIVGLISDVGVIAASAVYTVANVFAYAFGPNSFFGVPYALATVVANSAAAVGRTLIGAPLDAASAGPFPVTYGVLNGLAFFTPQLPPPGANDPSIKVTPEHPLPIILINGTIATQGENWSVGAPVLANAGYKVYSFNYGNIFGDPNFPIQATDDIRESARQLAAEVDRVLAETKAPKVILIGHSQGGGILPSYYINNLGGAAKVSQLIGIAPSNHGTDVDYLVGLLGLPILGPLVTGITNYFGQALLQQAVGSSFQQEVYGNGDTRPGVLYTTIASMTDEVVTPYTQQALNGPNVTNIVLQDLYPGLPAAHLGVVLSPQVWSVVLDALASNPAASPQLDEELVA